MRRVVIGIVLAMMAALPLHAGTPLPDGPHVVVSGYGRATAKPDRAVARLSVNVREPTAAEAKSRVDAAVNSYLEVLKRRGVATEDVNASAISVNQDYDYENGRQVARGFRGSRNVSVRFRKPDSINALIDEGLAAGMNTVDSVEFESSRADDLRMEARNKAAMQSRQRGEELAKAYGARLGGIYSINSIGSNIMSRYGAGLDMVNVSGTVVAPPPPAPVAPSSPGQYIAPTIEFNEQVQVVFDLIR